MEGGITVILTLMILFGAIAGGVALFGAGGWVRRRQIENERSAADEGKGGEEGAQRPQHTVVEDDSRDVELPRRPSTDPPPPPE